MKQVLLHGGFDLRRRPAIDPFPFGVPEESTKILRGFQSGVNGRDGKGVDTPFFLPQIIGRQGQSGVVVPVGSQKVSATYDQVFVLVGGEFNLTESIEMEPQGPKHQGGAVFLNGQSFLAVGLPGLPGASQTPVRMIFVKKKAHGLLAFVDDIQAEVEKGPGGAQVAGHIQGIGGEGPGPAAELPSSQSKPPKTGTKPQY